MRVPAAISILRNAARRHAVVARYFATWATVAGAVLIIPRTPLDGPVGGVLAVIVILSAAWRGGAGPAVLFPLLIYMATRLLPTRDVKPFTPTGREVMTLIIMTVLTTAVGLAGQYRRRLRASRLEYLIRIGEQTKALSLARILFRDLDGRITTWTEGTERLFGWTSAEATGRVLHELLNSRFPIPVAEVQRELLLTGQWQGEVVQRHKNGSELVVSTHCILYRGADDGPTTVAEVHTDVTEERRAQAALRESDHRKDVFIATLAHELRNPLAPVRSGLDLLRMTREADPDEATVLDMMGRQLTHMVRLIDDLLDISRINTGKVTLSRQTVSLDEIVHDALAAARPQIEAAGHELTVTLPDTRVILHADPARLSQVLTNLLNNAAKFTTTGGRICLTANHRGRQLEIEVADNGIGISAEALPRVFDMFAQSENLHVRSHGGMGLGLNIVRALVEMHGGSVAAHSDGPNTGSQFTIRIPCLAGQQPLPAVNGSSHNGHANHDGQFKQASRISCVGRLLIVDDNQDAARLLAQTLQRIGCECRQAYDGPAALKIAEEFDPQAFVLDLGMPEMSGYDVARRLRANPRFQHALLIAVTGWDKENDRRCSREAGFDHHLAKPVSVQDLTRLLGASQTASV